MTITFLMQREPSVNNATLSKVYIGGNYLWDVVEDVVRELPGVPVEQWKQHGVTAIPSGVYEIVFENSGRFGPDTLTLLDVPAYSYIRIHAGNTAANTEGCLLPGLRNSNCTVKDSRITLQKWKDLVRQFKRDGYKVLIDIRNA